MHDITRSTQHLPPRPRLQLTSLCLPCNSSGTIGRPSTLQGQARPRKRDIPRPCCCCCARVDYTVQSRTGQWSCHPRLPRTIMIAYKLGQQRLRHSRPYLGNAIRMCEGGCDCSFCSAVYGAIRSSLVKLIFVQPWSMTQSVIVTAASALR